jgi:hypothetical protein
MRSLASLLAAALSAATAAQTPPEDCACLWQGSFSEVVQTTDLVVAGEVSGRKGNAIDLSVQQSLHGPAWHESIRIWMKAASYCRPPVEQFSIGSRWVLALHKIDVVPENGFNPSTPSISYGRVGDYRLSNCGGYWLRVNGNLVEGNLLPEMPRWDYQPPMRGVPLPLLSRYIHERVHSTKDETEGQANSDSATLDAMRQASQEDPALRELMLDTRQFLRGYDSVEVDSPSNGN